MIDSAPIFSDSHKAWRTASRLFTRPDGGGPTAAFSLKRLIVGAGLTLSLLQGCAGQVYHYPQENPKNWDCAPAKEMSSLRADLSMEFADHSLLNRTIRDHALQSGLDVCVYTPTQYTQNADSKYGAAAFYATSRHAVVAVSPHIPSSALAHEFVHVDQFSLPDHGPRLLLLQQSGRYTELMENMLLSEAGATAIEVIELFQEARHKDDFFKHMLMESTGGSHHAMLVVELIRSLGDGLVVEEDLGSKDRLAEKKLLDRLMATYLAKGVGPHLQGYMQEIKMRAKESQQTEFDWKPASFTDKSISEVALGTLYPDTEFPLTKKVLTDLGPILSAVLRQDIVGDKIDVPDIQGRFESLGNIIESSQESTRRATSSVSSRLRTTPSVP